MKILRNKFLIGIFCIVIGVTVGFVLLPRSQDADTVMAKVVRLRQDVEAGTKLEKAMLEITAIPAESVPDGASSAIESFLNRYASSRLYKGDILTAAKVRDTLVDPVAAAAAKGKQLVSVTVPSLSAGVSGTLQPGDVVSIMVTSKVTQFNQNLGLITSVEDLEETSDWQTGSSLISSVTKESQTYIPEELRYLEVCKVSSSDGTDALVNGDKDKEEPNRLPVTITFYATEAQALKLAEVEQNGEIHVTFVARGNAADAYIPRDERVLVDIEVPEETAMPDAEIIPNSDAFSQSVANEEPGIEPTPDPADQPIDFNNPEVGE